MKRMLVWCEACKRKHWMAQLPCGSCGYYTTLQIVSEAVAETCKGMGGEHECSGCEAYKDHLR